MSTARQPDGLALTSAAQPSNDRSKQQSQLSPDLRKTLGLVMEAPDQYLWAEDEERMRMGAPSWIATSAIPTYALLQLGSLDSMRAEAGDFHAAVIKRLDAMDRNVNAMKLSGAVLLGAGAVLLATRCLRKQTGGR